MSPDTPDAPPPPEDSPSVGPASSSSVHPEPPAPISSPSVHPEVSKDAVRPGSSEVSKSDRVSHANPGKTASGRVRKVPPCKRCGNAEWTIETRPKATIRWAIENVFAAPDVWIFQSESAGWPARTYERWTCTSCGRTARVS